MTARPIRPMSALRREKVHREQWSGCMLDDKGWPVLIKMRVVHSSTI